MHGVLPSSSDESVKLVQADELATKANSKLVREAKRPEHCLLRLVLTANLLDGMLSPAVVLKVDADVFLCAQT